MDSTSQPRPKPAPATEQDLLAQIYASPDDDGVRAVYADLLSTRGDARGELINLQLLAKPGKAQRDRIKQLLSEYQMQQWLGELAEVVLPSNRGSPRYALDRLRYERGFPVAGSLRSGASQAAIERLTGHPAWRTFHALDVRGDRPGYADFLADEVFYGLRELTTVSAVALRKFVEPAPRALTRMLVAGNFDGHTLPASVREGLLAGQGLPQLRTLALDYHYGNNADGLARLLASPLGERLTKFEAETSGVHPGALERIVATVLLVDPPQLHELEFRCNDRNRHASFHYALRRESAGWTMRATYETRSRKTDGFSMLTELLTQLREQGTLARLSKLEVQTPRRYTATVDARTRLRRAARGLELVLQSS